MKEIIYNDSNLHMGDINNLVKRAKVLIINSNDELLLACTDHNYFLVGGHVDGEESDRSCIIREIKEETGCDIECDFGKPILRIKYMCKDYPDEGDNTLFVSNYYVAYMDIKFDMKKSNLTEEEKSENFSLRYVKVDEVLKFLEESLVDCTKPDVVFDTLHAILTYLEEYREE